MGKVLITCTQPRADEIVSDLNLVNIKAIACPALHILKTGVPSPDGHYDAMLVTSVHALEETLPDLPVIAVGKKTAAAAQDKGLYVIHTGQSGITDLDLSRYKNILYPCATEPTDIPENAIPWPVYKTTANPDFLISDDTDTLCVFSAKAARQTIPYIKPDLLIICLSQTIADAIENHPADNLVVCDTPRYDVMKQILIKRHVRT